MWNDPNYQEGYKKSFTSLKKSLESMLDTELKASKKRQKGTKEKFEVGCMFSHPIEFFCQDSNDVYLQDGNMMLQYGNSDVKIPSSFSQASPEMLSEILQQIYLEAQNEGENATLQRLANLLPGESLSEKIENGTKSIENREGNVTSFLDMMKDGKITKIWEKEKTLVSYLNRYHYEEAILHNLEAHFITSKKRSNILRKRDPAIHQVHPRLAIASSELGFETETDDSLSMSDGNGDNEGANTPPEYVQTVITERVINTTRRPDTALPKLQKTQKNIVTLKKSSPAWVANYRAQETLRYQNPLQPWEFILQEGFKAIVAPVSKKPVSLTSKPRDHVIFKKQRPPYITILCLVRDAAAKLPCGKGTRADIVYLLKESQYVNTNLSPAKISGIVSGALDRLHYEADPCVRYDPETKMWLYLHKDRTLDYPEWKDDSETASNHQARRK